MGMMLIQKGIIIKALSICLAFLVLFIVLSGTVPKTVRGDYWETETTNYILNDNITEGDHSRVKSKVDGTNMEISVSVDLIGGEGTNFDVFLVNESNYEKYTNGQEFETIYQKLRVSSDSFSYSSYEMNKTFYSVVDNSNTFTNPPNNGKDDYIHVHIEVSESEYKYVSDSDNDLHPDYEDDFPNDPNEWKDTDSDGVGDNSDAFDDDPTQWSDRDGDGYGDNDTGNSPDAFPDDPSEWQDSDGDGVGDNSDALPDDPTEIYDTDSDGMGDNADSDDDNDGILDEDDPDPLDPSVPGNRLGMIDFLWLVILIIIIVLVLLILEVRFSKRKSFEVDDFLGYSGRSSRSFKSSPLVGIIFLIFCMIFITTSLYSFHSGFDLWFVGLLLGIAFSLLIIGYYMALIREITIDENGIIIKHGTKSIFQRRWNEISMIRTDKKMGGEYYVNVLVLYLSDNEKYEIKEGNWNIFSIKDVFREITKYQEKYRFKVEDNLHLGDEW